MNLLLLINDRANDRSHKAVDRESTEKSVTFSPPRKNADLQDQDWISGTIRRLATR